MKGFTLLRGKRTINTCPCLSVLLFQCMVLDYQFNAVINHGHMPMSACLSVLGLSWRSALGNTHAHVCLSVCFRAELEKQGKNPDGSEPMKSWSTSQQPPLPVPSTVAPPGGLWLQSHIHHHHHPHLQTMRALFDLVSAVFCSSSLPVSTIASTIRWEWYSSDVGL